ncbi:MAG: hydroxymethylbilane synthase [Alphaproteobacteria bacterium]|nr:hydroxymethylbilane synthase [Alphaproteobacteria bacterium]
MKKIFRIGERSSPLSLIQAELVRTALLRQNPELEKEYEIELIPIRTSGDWSPEKAEQLLGEVGENKGVFTKEIDEALMSGRIDAAVHSMKDVSTIIPDYMEIAAMMERADPRDAFLSLKAQQLMDLPEGATVGTSSVRRKAQLLAQRPDLKITPLRGNIETRLQKLANGMADATILAVAGLQRMGLDHRITRIMDTETMLPSPGQGAIGIIIKRNHAIAHDLISPIDHEPTSLCVAAERSMLSVLDGSCSTPIAALGRMASDKIIVLEGMVVRPDGTGMLKLQNSGPAQDAEKIGMDLGNEFKSKLPSDFFKCA